MLQQSNAYFSPKLEVRRWENQSAVYAVAPINKGEILSIWTSGKIIHATELAQVPDAKKHHTIQIEDEFYMTPTVSEPEPPDYINHSCDPNASLAGNLTLVALRDIAVGEQIGFDYATADSTPYDEFDCLCGATICRGAVRADDWKHPELQTKYQGHFMPYLQRRIDKLHG